MATAMPAAGTRRRTAVPCASESRRRVTAHPSPNHGPRRGGVRPDLIVLHHTAMESAGAALARLCDPAAEVSAHYLICERGRVWQLVDEGARAWHAGAGRWGDVRDVNSRSIGIELANRGDHPYPLPQMTALEALMGDVMARWAIPPARVIAHSDMAPGRKSDPGPRFDWRGLARAGLSVWPDARGDGRADWAAFLRDAARFGYPAGDVPRELLLGVFRLRFRPQAEGPLSAADCAAMDDLAARFAVDRAEPSA
ncbi:N-acetylmuramoyl-L-alanine amidase [Roseovarius ramblicola]|uniref:N-acetylmuramoyl-L-alanine amidase n=1 Tax=Roseovarius ramblicola TaxID=2022336 RepID=A0ABV5HUQ0_9RHOB